MKGPRIILPFSTNKSNDILSKQSFLIVKFVTFALCKCHCVNLLLFIFTLIVTLSLCSCFTKSANGFQSHTFVGTSVM